MLIYMFFIVFESKILKLIRCIYNAYCSQELKFYYIFNPVKFIHHCDIYPYYYNNNKCYMYVTLIIKPEN